MRITNQLQHQMLSSGIIKNQSDVYRLQQQISTGEKLTTASDDPVAWAEANRLNRLQSQLGRYEDNSTLVESRLTAMDSSLDTIGDILQRASELAVEASEGTLSDSDRTNLAEEADQLLEEMVSQANRKYDGQYLFGGTQTATAPFEVTYNEDGSIDSVSYAGTEEVAEVEVADSDMMGLQMVGGGSNGVLMSADADAFAAIIEMRDRLLAGENLAETEIQGSVDEAYDQVLMGRAVVGAQMDRLEFVATFREAQSVEVDSLLSDCEDVDVAAAVAELSAKNVAYEAALAMSSKAMNISLLNYI